MPLLGQLALWLALLMALWGVVTGFVGARLDRTDLQESARRAAVACAIALGTAVVSLLFAALRQDFHLAYVAAHADRMVERHEAWVVVLDGLAGQWLVVGLLLATGLTATRPGALVLDRRALAFGAAVGSLALVAIVMALLVAGRPFDLLSFTPLDGQGLSQHLYDLDARIAVLVRCLAYAATGVALSRLAGDFLAGQPDVQLSNRPTVHPTRAWALIAWVLLTAEVSWSLFSGLRDNQPGAVLRPALLVWVMLTVFLHVRRSTTGFAAHVTHLGALFVAAGLIVSFFRTHESVHLRPGESVPVGSYTIRYLASSVYPAGNQIISQGLVEVLRGERSIGRVATVRRQQFDVFGKERGVPVVRAGSWHGLAGSVFVRLESRNGESGPSNAESFDVTVVPFVPGLLLGCWLLGLGGLAALWPARSRT